MSPFGFIVDGLDEMEAFIEPETGDRWMFATEENKLQIKAML